MCPENPSEPFGASVIIDGVTYGTGTASSKKLAKNKAGKVFAHNFFLCFCFLSIIIYGCCSSDVTASVVCFFFSFLISARATLEILIPDFVKQTAEEKPVEGDELEVRLLIVPVFGTKKTTKRLSPYSPLQYFNHISIEDSRVYELTNKAGLLSPYQILHECLKR